jgi:pimeloyl-ACP methyl ester carboxylesterase
VPRGDFDVEPRHAPSHPRGRSYLPCHIDHALDGGLAVRQHRPVMEKTMAQAVVPIHGVLSTAKDRESQSVTRGTARAGTYLEAPNKRVSANGIDYAYRELGDGAVPLVLLHHFRGNLDYWDPALIDALASTRRVVTFDNAGVGGSTGMTPSTVEQMAHDAIAFLTAMELAEVDVLGFSIGSFVAQEMALIRPSLVRKLVLASSAPKGAAGMHGWGPEVIKAVGAPEPDPNGYLRVFFTGSTSSQRAGQEVFERFLSRASDPDEQTNWQTRQAQYDAVCAWGIPESRIAATTQRHRPAGVRGQRRQRPHDPSSLLLSARRVDPACTPEDLPRLGARVPVPAPRRVCRRRRRVPHCPPLKNVVKAKDDVPDGGPSKRVRHR